VETVVVAHRATEKGSAAAEPSKSYGQWQQPTDPVEVWKNEARDQLLIAMRDGDLHAKGRLSITRSGRSWADDSQWKLHSGYHQSITPEQWREGEFGWKHHKLTTFEWEFIDIRMPRFVVKAIWPDFVPPVAPNAVGTGESDSYSPPYLTLMQEAIVHFNLSDTCQEKKDVLVDWFLSKPINDAPLSRNLARAMATLVRLPSAQRGGAKRSFPPGYSRAS
jgi:hypothetical protein